LMTPLKGTDNQIYAMAQGNILVGGAGASANGSKVQVNHLSVGRIPGGATVEKQVVTSLGDAGTIQLELASADFTTAHRVVEAINKQLGASTANAVDGRVIRVRAPVNGNDRVAFMADIENITINPGQSSARVILNPRTGSVVMNQPVALETCAVAHGNLSVVVSTDPVISQPNALSGGQTVSTARSQVEIRQEPGQVMMLKGGASLSDVVKALNSIGATPQDLLAILQALKAAGALRAELEII
jgi:flagellar P-ring protein FlgI